MLPIGGLIVAAGRSSRMGRAKALIHVGGQPALVRLAEVMAASGLSPIVVVVSQPVQELAETIASVEVVLGDPDQPMVDSIALGIAQIRDRVRAAVIQPVDAPFTTPEMVAELIAGGEQVARVLCHEGRAGHPVLVPKSLFSEIEERPGGGLRAVLADHDIELVEWPDDRVLADLDTPVDLDQWQLGTGGRLH